MKKKKILIVNDIIFGGGVEKLMYDFTMRWHKKHEITILTGGYEKAFYDLYPEDVKYIHTDHGKKYPNTRIGRQKTIWKNRIYNRQFQRKFDHAKYDMVIALKDGGILSWVSSMNIPEKYAWHHTDYAGNYYTESVFGSKEKELEATRKFKKVVCVSEQIKKSFIEVVGDPGNLVVGYNPIPVDEILEKAKEPVVDIPTEKEDGIVRFVTVGRINRQKGFDLLLEASHMLEKEGLKFEIWVVGGKEPWGNEYRILMQRQRCLDVKNVKFIGARENPWKYIKHADWFLSTSIFEGYSLVSQEAAVLDVPLLLTDCSGVRELLGDSEYGMIMPISVLGIYEGMKKVILNPELQEHYKTKIMERKSIIDFDEHIEKLEEMIGI